MPKRALTAAAVERLKPPAKGQVDHFDAGYPGLALRISYGGGRSWVFFYRIHGKQRRLTLGTFPALSLAEAREAWRAARRSVEEGTDPAATKAEAKRRQPDTVRAVGELFIEKWHRGRNRTADEVARMFERHLYVEIGERDIRTVTRRDILDMLDNAEKRGAKVAVNRVLANVRRLFTWAVERGILDTSPVAAVKAPAPETPRDRVLTDDELRAFLRACERLDEPRRGASPEAHFGSLFRLLLLSGQRRDEVAAARRVEIDLGGAMWSLPAERVKNKRAHRLPLSSQSVALIEALPNGSPLLFPARFTRPARTGEVVKAKRDVRPVSGFGRAKVRLDDLMLEELQKLAEARGDDPAEVMLPEWRLHDLRRTAASGMARLGVAVHVVEKLLNHVSGTISGVAAVYNRHAYTDEMRAAAQAWANYLDGLTAERPSNVVALAEVR